MAKPLVFVARSLIDEFQILLYISERNAGLFKANDEFQPSYIAFAVLPNPRYGPICF